MPSTTARQRNRRALSETASSSSSSATKPAESPSRIRRLLALLALTTILLLGLQAYRFASRPSSSSSSGENVALKDAEDAGKSSLKIAAGAPALVPRQSPVDHPVSSSSEKGASAKGDGNKDLPSMDEIDLSALRAMYDALHDPAARVASDAGKILAAFVDDEMDDGGEAADVADEGSPAS